MARPHCRATAISVAVRPRPRNGLIGSTGWAGRLIPAGRDRVGSATMSATGTGHVSVRTEGDVALVTIDDGKANAFTHDIIGGVHAALDASADAAAVVVAGRPGRFSAGFDLSVMQSGPESARRLLGAGAELAVRIYEHPTPTVAACTGHAIAMGAIFLLAFDVRIGADGAFKLGMNEVAIGMPVPRFATTLARDRLSSREFTRATALATLYEPTGAVGAGYLDRVTEDPVAAALEEATALATHVSPGGFRATRAIARSGVAAAARAGLVDDLATFTVEPPAPGD